MIPKDSSLPPAFAEAATRRQALSDERASVNQKSENY